MLDSHTRSYALVLIQVLHTHTTSPIQYYNSQTMSTVYFQTKFMFKWSTKYTYEHVNEVDFFKSQFMMSLYCTV